MKNEIKIPVYLLVRAIDRLKIITKHQAKQMRVFRFPYVTLDNGRYDIIVRARTVAPSYTVDNTAGYLDFQYDFENDDWCFIGSSN